MTPPSGQDAETCEEDSGVDATVARIAAVDRHHGRRRWMLGALVAQVYLAFVIVDIVTSHHPMPLVVMGVVCAVAFGAVYVVMVAMVFNDSLARRIAVLAALFLLSLPQWFVIGADLTALWIFIGVAAGALLRPLAAVVVGVVLALAMLGLDAVASQPLQWELAVTLVALNLWMIGFAANIRLNIELHRTRDELARTAVTLERERIGRDLHDILGHSLTAIAVKAGLARRLLDRDPASAAAEITDVERLAREALSDVRATAAGYRDVSLAGELAVARSVLQAAGIHPVLPTAVDDVSPAGRAVFGYVVREAVTNVIRHSGATRCEIILTPSRLEIRDNGVGAGGPRKPAGSGIDGLARRVADAGGRFESGPLPEGGFHVVAWAEPGSTSALPTMTSDEASLTPVHRSGESLPSDATR
jgi:two-component system sensor histidine kinase DesK